MHKKNLIIIIWFDKQAEYRIYHIQFLEIRLTPLTIYLIWFVLLK